MQKITTCLWFDGKAEEAARFYTSIFKNSKITKVIPYGDAGPMPKGTAMVVVFEIEGQEFSALNGGPQYHFTPAISQFVSCDDQAEIDHVWDGLLADGGKAIQCGWLTDKYGVTWQVVPRAMIDKLTSGDPAKTSRMMKAMMGMVKLDIAALQRAYDGA